MLQKQAKRHIIRELRRQIDWLVARIGMDEKLLTELLTILEDEDTRPEWKTKRAALTIRDYLDDAQR